MASAKYTAEQQAAYKAGLAAAAKKKPRRRTTGAAPAGRKRKRSTRKKGSGKPRSKCTMKIGYNTANGWQDKPCIKGWRIDRNFGFQSIICFLGANNGEVKNSDNRERYLNFVCKLVSKAGVTTVNGVYDGKHEYLKIIELGLVVKPKTGKFGYFGPGGSYLKDKVKK